MCLKCKRDADTISLMAAGVYYVDVCHVCAAELRGDSSYSSGYQGYDRRRQYEDYAQDTIQPWDAAGKPNVEFLRLYPESAKKQYSPEIIEELKRKL